MCGRFALTCDLSFYERFSVENDVKCQTRYNIAPTQEVPVIVKESPNKVVMMRWGLIPFWARDEKIGYRMINARGENAPSRPAFRVPLKHRRCLVPATGFYEWKALEGRKAPYYFRMKDNSYFAFAGLYDKWINPEGKEIKTFTFLTTKPNAIVEPIHDRMPVILRRSDEEIWLSNEILDPKRYAEIIKPYPSDKMDTYAVSTLVNAPTTDSRELIEPI